MIYMYHEFEYTRLIGYEDVNRSREPGEKSLDSVAAEVLLVAPVPESRVSLMSRQSLRSNLSNL